MGLMGGDIARGFEESRRGLEGEERMERERGKKGGGGLEREGELERAGEEFRQNLEVI